MTIAIDKLIKIYNDYDINDLLTEGTCHLFSTSDGYHLFILETRPKNNDLLEIETFFEKHFLAEIYAIYSNDLDKFINSLPSELKKDLDSYSPSEEPYSFEESLYILQKELIKKLAEANASLTRLKELSKESKHNEK